mgnify:FL=1
MCSSDLRHVDSAGQARLSSVDPSTERVLWQLPAGHPADVALAVEAGEAAFRSDWSRDRSGRVAALLRLCDLLDLHASALAELDTREIGIPITVTSGDVSLATSIIRDLLGMLDDVGVDAEPPSRRVPRGVVGVLAPWNFPFFVAVTKVAPILAVGNCVVLKPTELASASAVRLAELAHDAGLPAGVLNVVPGRGDVVGEALVRHPGVAQVNLTGSTATGRRVLSALADSTLTPALTELGGKSAHVVGEHVSDLEAVADAVAQGIFWGSGQVCTAGSRLIVHERHHDELLELLVARTVQWQPGDPFDPTTPAGPLGSEAHMTKVLAHIDQARHDGGRIVAGGSRSARPGWFVPPTIVDDVTSSHRLFSTEVFGPVLAITRCSDVHDGVRLANATEYGLSATGWSDDPGEIDVLADGLRAGWVSVNPHLLGPVNPRAGAESVGWSGSGVEGGLPAMRAATRLTVVHTGRPNVPTNEES